MFASPRRDAPTRLLAATITLVARDGYRAATVEDTCALAGVSPEVFTHCFASLETCFLAAFDDVIARGCLEIVEASRGAPSFGEQVGTAMLALLSFLDRQPDRARFVVVESFGVSKHVLWRRSRVLDRFVEALHSGGSAALGGGLEVPKLAVARQAVLCVHSVVFDSLVGGGGELVPLAGVLTGLVLAPYLGEEVAGRVAWVGGRPG